MKKLEIYTDGACSGNPGPGGYAAIVITDGGEEVVSGGFADTTNNRMELIAAIEGLKSVKEKSDVSLYSDSAYLINCFEKRWIDSWKKNGWKNASKEPVKNKDLWEDLDRLRAFHKIKWIKVKGHSDNKYNNRCDEIARSEISKLSRR
jgi:ribonuclease HI